MAIIAYFYLLRVGEYTYSAAHKRTRPFTVADVTFWAGTTMVPNHSPRDLLLKTVTSATMSILNQKNGKRNQSVNHHASHTDYCPVRALIMRVSTIMANTANPNTGISTYFPRTKYVSRELTAADVNRAIKHAVTALRLETNGLTPAQVGSHSLRAGGAMAMYLNGVPHDTIRKMGRWASDTFLMYVHEQISAVSEGVAIKMSNPIPFHNVLQNRSAQP